MNILRKFISGVLILGLGLSLVQSGYAQAYSQGEPLNSQGKPLYEKGELYIKFKDDSKISANRIIAKEFGSSASRNEKLVMTSALLLDENLVRKYQIEEKVQSLRLFDSPELDKTFKIKFNYNTKSGDIYDLMRELNEDPRIEYVERVPLDYLFSYNAENSDKEIGGGTDGYIPNDPLYNNNYGKDNLDLRWYLDLVKANLAWNIQKGDPNIKIAIVDNSVYAKHEDLQIPEELQYNCVTGLQGNSNPPAHFDSNQMCNSNEFNNGSCDVYDISHGTHCAGVIGAIHNNEIGIAGIAGGVTLMGVAGPSPNGSALISNSYGGVAWAAENGAKIINCSWGSEAYSVTHLNLMKTCAEQGIFIVAAAGNDGHSKIQYPCGYRPYVITVGSVDISKTRSYFSNFGPWVDIMAPGGKGPNNNIFSTTFCLNQSLRLSGVHDFDEMRYDEMVGTSMACPVAVGVMGLILSKNPDITVEQMRYILQETGEELANRAQEKNLNAYCKIVDAYAALKFIDTVKMEFGKSVDFDSIKSSSSHDTVFLSWTKPQTEDKILGYNVYRNGTIIAEKLNDTAIIDTALKPGMYAYAIEPVYEKSQRVLRAEHLTTVDYYFPISVIIRPDTSAGIVEGVDTYRNGTRALLIAKANNGYAFDYWLDHTLKRIGTYPETFCIADAAKVYFAFFRKLGSNENEVKHDIRIAPNPAIDNISIACEVDILKVEVYDMQSRKIYSKECKTNNLDVDIANWASGMYTVVVTCPDGDIKVKMIKQ